MRGLTALPRGWPIAVALVGWPLWWALGVTPLVFPLVAAALLPDLLRRDRLRVPPGFWLYLLFLLVVVVSAVMLDATAPGTLPPDGPGRYATFVLRLFGYLAMAVLMLYLGNTSESELPRLRVVRWLALLATWSILLGLLAVLLPRFSFPTAVSLLPGSLPDLLGENARRADLAQVQPVLGLPAPRPAATYAFTNAWGNATSLTLVWLVLLAVVTDRRAVRVGVGVLLIVLAVPVTYSLNRGMWIGLTVSLIYLAVGLAARGRLLPLGAVTLVVGLAATVFVLTPLQGMVTERLTSGHSNGTRTTLARSRTTGRVPARTSLLIVLAEQAARVAAWSYVSSGSPLGNTTRRVFVVGIVRNLRRERRQPCPNIQTAGQEPPDVQELHSPASG